MTQVFSVIALKGGVGKTTTCVGLAHMFATDFFRRVLVIDLDPQASASEMLMGAALVSERARAGRTVACAFRDPNDARERWFAAEDSIERGVGGIAGIDGIDLLPASASLYTAQESPVFHLPGQTRIPPHALLRAYIAPVMHRYDVVIIDCPPNFGPVTQNGIYASHGYLIPVIPDVLSTRGVPQLLQMIREFNQRSGHRIVPLGMVAVKMQVNSRVHTETLGRLRTLQMLIPVFPQVIPQTNHIAAAANFGHVASLAQKWGHPAIPGLLRTLCQMISQRLDQICVKAA